MKKHVSYANFLFLLVVGLVIHAAVTQTIWSLITALCLVFVVVMDTVKGASYYVDDVHQMIIPYQTEPIISNHQQVYIKALERKMRLIQAYRDLWRSNVADNGDVWYGRYDREKMTYSRLFVRYQEAKKRYGWND